MLWLNSMTIKIFCEPFSTKVESWYVEVDYEKLGITLPAFGALQAYWPSLQVLDGNWC